MLAWTQLKEPGPALLIFVLAITAQVATGAPLDDFEQQSSEIEYYPVADATGCYYNFEHYDEGDRIITNEPCLNCTCHNRMLMCYLRVCPFTKAIGQDCKMEKKSDQCCPVITCPEVPVHLLPHTSTTPSTAVGHLNDYGCSIDNLFYADGAKVPSNPNNPCEVCYCIRNKTACIIQECTLTGKVVEGCRPVYVDGVCCPVRYDCDHPELEITPRPLLTTTTTTLPPTTAPTDCIYHNEVYADGALVKKDVPCEQCYCMKGDIICAVQECGPTPLDKVNCTALPPKEGQCCPDTYECENISEEDLTTLTYYEAPTTQPTEILSNESSTPSETEGLTTTIQGKEQPSAETGDQVTESIAQSTEDIGAEQPVTESATVESFTSRITEAVEAITSKVTEIVEAFTSTVSRSDQETTLQPQTQTTEPEGSIATEKSETTDQQIVTESEVEKETKPEIVTEAVSQGTVSQEGEDSKTTVLESVTESFEVPAHDDENEDESQHEDENDIEGSGKPIEEHQTTPSVTETSEIEDKHTGPIDQQLQTESGLLTTEKITEITEEGSGAPEEQTSILPVEPDTTPQAGVVTSSTEGEQGGLPTLEPENHVKGTEPSQVITEESITKETIEPLEEKQGTTAATPVIDSEAQETVQPLEPERSTEQTKSETPVTLETITTEQEETLHITQGPEEQVTKEITEKPKETVTETEKPEDKLNEVIPSVEESQTTVKSNELEQVPIVTEEPVKEIEQGGTISPEEQKPTDIEEVKPVTTTEKEELEIITEIQTKETERPESMDHISETASLTPTSEPVIEDQITEKTIEKEAAEKGIDTVDTEQTTDVTQSVTEPETLGSDESTGTPGLDESTGTPVSSEIPAICDDKDCKTTQDQNEIPIPVEESCTKENCKPQEQLPSSETGTTVPVICDSEHGCAQSVPEEGSKTTEEQTPVLLEKETPIPEECKDEQGCLPVAPGKETDIKTDKEPDHYPSICDKDSGCVSEKTSEETPIESPALTTETIDYESATQTTTAQSERQTVSEAEPESVTKQAASIPEQAASTTEQAASITEQPASITEQPAGITEKPASITEQPATITEQTASITEQTASITEPTASITEQPASITEQPASITEQPASITEQPASITEQPASITEQTASITEQPASITEQPAIITEEPASITEQPGSITEQPASITEQPASITEQPASITEQPASITEQPASITEQPASITEKPASITEQPASITEQPASTTEQAARITEHPESIPEQTETVEGSGGESTDFSEHGTATEEYETASPDLKAESQTQENIPIEKGTEKEPELESTEGEIAGIQTTVQSDLEQQTEIATGPEKVTPLPDEVTSKESVTPEIPKEESDLSVSPISPEITETPISTQKTEVSSHTELPGQEQDVSTEIYDITEQTETKQTQPIEIYPVEADVVDETTPSVEKITFEPVSSESTPITEVNIPSVTESDTTQSVSDIIQGVSEVTQGVSDVTQGVSDITQATSAVEDSQTTESGEIPKGQEVAETPAPTIPQVPETTDKISVDSKTTESVTETQVLEDTKVSGSTPSLEITITEKTEIPEQEIRGTEAPATGETQGPYETPAVFVTTEETSSESTKVSDETLPQEPETPQTTSSILSEIPESTEQVASEGTASEVPQSPVQTEVTISPTESETEVTSEPEEHGIPGEGSCLVDGQTYKNNSHVPPINQCQTSCKCVSSILQCESIPCTPPPSNLQCVPIFHSPDACCPVYSCSVPGVTSMESDSHVVETTTAGEESLITQVSPKEETVTSEIVTEKVLSVTTMKPEIITEIQSGIVPKEPVSETEVTEQLPVKPTEAAVAEEVTKFSGSQITTQKEAVTETEEVAIVTEFETKETSVPETQTIISDKQTTIAGEGVTSTPLTKPSEEHIPSQDDIGNEIVEEPIHSDLCGSDGCAPVETTELPEEETVTGLPEVSQPLEPEAPREPEVKDQVATETEERVPETTIASVTVQPQEEISEQTEHIKTSEAENAVPDSTESITSQRPVEEETEISVTQPQEIPERTEDTSQKEGELPGTTETVISERPIEGETQVSITEQPQKEVSEHTEGIKISDKEEEEVLPDTTETAVPERPIEGETEIPVTQQPEEEIPGHTTESIKISDKEDVVPSVTESVVPEKQGEKETEASVTERPQEEVPDQTESIKISDKESTTEGVIPIEEGTVTSLTEQPQEEVSEHTEGIKTPEKESTLPDITESSVSIEGETEISITHKPQDDFTEQTEESALPGATETGVQEKPAEGETETTVTDKPQEEISEPTEGIKVSTEEGIVPVTTESEVPEKQTEKGVEASVTEQPQEVSEQTESIKTSDKEEAVSGTTESVTPDIEDKTEVSITQKPQEVPEQTERVETPEIEGVVPDTTQSVITEQPIEGETEAPLTEQPSKEVPEQTESIKISDKDEVLPEATESAVPGKPIEGETQQPQEEIPEQTESTKISDKEGVLPDTTPTVISESSTEGETEISITKQPQEVPEQTEGLKTPEEGTTESIVEQKPTEIETEISKTEQPETTEPVTAQGPVSDSSGFETSPETVTETSSEESSKTPEEMAAVPEIEEAVTTPPVLTITESEVSLKDSEQTTISVEEEPEATSEKRPDIAETDQTTISQEAEITTRPQFEGTSVSAVGETKEPETSDQTTLPSEVPSDHIGTTHVLETVTPKFESITELNIIDTTLPLETEAQVTLKQDQESEKPKDFTEVPVTETVPEVTTKQVLEQATTKLSATEIPEEGIITEQIPAVEQQPSKPLDSESEKPATEKLTPSTGEITEPTTIKSEETEISATEEAIIPEKESEVPATESEQQELDEFPTHAPVVTEISTGTSVITEEDQPAKSTEELLTSKPTEQTLVGDGDVTTAKKEEPIYTSPHITTQGPLNISELYTSGPQVEFSTKKSVEGQLSTSAPVAHVSTSESSTSTPTYAPPPAPGHDIPGEQVPELPDYHSPVEDYEDEDQGPLGPGTCRYGGKVYVSAQQIPRDDPCDFCFCFRSDIICLQQSCPPPIPRCHEEPIRGFCCPRYECPVGMATSVNVTTSTTTTTTTLPPHFLSHAYKGRVTKSGCQIKGRAYQVGDVIPSASGPCLQCTCGGDGEMKCDPKACSPEPMLRQMIAAAASRRRR